MIPKVIHYCWFGGNTKPASVLKCIESWKKYCPDYEIREWNEENFPVGDNLYCKQAYEAKKWAFATDYARLVIVYNNGGIYLDTDVEVIKPLDDLLNHKFFIGRQQGFQVNTGSGFGAEKGHPVLKRMIDDYEGIPFISKDGEMDLLTCPKRNSQWLFENGMRNDDSFQEIHGVTIYPTEYFSPFDVWSGRMNVTDKTYSIHHCDATWNPDENKKSRKLRFLKYRLMSAADFIIHIPNRILRLILGEDGYNKLKNR